MTQNTAYSSMISLRSRRLRTAGIALIVVTLLMSLYGALALMPAMKTATALHVAATHQAEAQKVINPAESAKTLRHIHRLFAVKVLFVNAYWLTCGLLVFAAMVVAWLDFREVARHYQKARTAIWESAAKILPAGERPLDS